MGQCFVLWCIFEITCNTLRREEPGAGFLYSFCVCVCLAGMLCARLLCSSPSTLTHSKILLKKKIAMNKITPTHLHRHMRNKHTQTQVCLAAHGDDLQIEMFHWLTSKIYKVLQGETSLYAPRKCCLTKLCLLSIEGNENTCANPFWNC